MSSGVPIPQWVAATATRFCGGAAVGLSSPAPCYQIDAGRGHDRGIVLTADEAEAVCKAILKDIRAKKTTKAKSSGQE